MSLTKPSYFVQKGCPKLGPCVQLKATRIVKNFDREGNPVVHFNLYEKKCTEPPVELVGSFYKFNWVFLETVTGKKLAEYLKN